MDALCGTSMNIDHRVVDGEIESRIEAILTVIDKVNKVDGFGLSSSPEHKTLRFSLSTKGARQFSESLLKWADEAEAEAATLTYKEVD